MWLYSFISLIFFSIFIQTYGQYNLYYSNRVNKLNPNYDCLHYKQFDDVTSQLMTYHPSNFYQIIPYCVRLRTDTKEQKIEMIRDHIQSNLTFKQLRDENVRAEDLLLWSASIDLVEDYQNYLDTSREMFGAEIFYNCTFPWFGSLCLYTFDSNEPFSEIVQKTFLAKYNYTDEISIVGITNLTCYIYLGCDRGPMPLCLDWREVCDGRIDCINDGVDEKHCSDLESNECAANEYRCHDGMCIPEQFLNDNPNNPDCLDHTDENNNQTHRTGQIAGIHLCYLNPTFLCEESDPFLSYRDFICGDGQQINVQTPSMVSVVSVVYPLRCSNGRHLILFQSIIDDALNSSSLLLQCKDVMRCIAFGEHGINCIKQLCRDQDFPCVLPIEKLCNSTSFVILPVLPFLRAYAQFGYWTNKSIIYENPYTLPSPDFVCYDIERCPFIPAQFTINHLTCAHMSSITQRFTYDRMIFLFHKCLSIEENGNETDCFDPSLFHCPNSSKCISKHRILDGVEDCPDNADEYYNQSCALNHRHRFQCTSEKRCISPVILRDWTYDCFGEEDEEFSSEEKVSFQNLCTRYDQSPSKALEGESENDQSNCEQWPCNNPYTLCDGSWNCPNGVDEINCDPTSACYPDKHQCLSPENLTMICLSMDKAGDGKIDCLGATDEREYCRRQYPDEFWNRYRCWNDTSCLYPVCDALSECAFENHTFIGKICKDDPPVQQFLYQLYLDSIQLGTFEWKVNKYFRLYDFNRFQSLRTGELSSMPIRDIATKSSSRVFSREIGFVDAWICNRGIVILIGLERKKSCLCPPSYYGDRCQFQEQRISLTLQFMKECAPICSGIYAIAVILVDTDEQIQSYDQLTYISTNNCNMKYNVYLLYEVDGKDLTKNYTIQIHAYDKIELSYHTSWILPIKFLFLPVNRVAAYLTIPSTSTMIHGKCPLNCGEHGWCAMYTNTQKYFCRCHSGWSGRNCAFQHADCDCSLKAICFGHMKSRSVCLCSSSRSGPRCLLHSICSQNPCKNGGQCIPKDDRISMNDFTCICQSKNSGDTCEMEGTRIVIAFRDVKIPQVLTVHLITTQDNDDPLIMTSVKKIAFDQETVVLYTSILFHLIVIQIDQDYYLGFLQVNASRLAHAELALKTDDQCAIVGNLLHERTRHFPLLRRVKYYHTLCRMHTQFSCIHDHEAFLCLCQRDGYADCFPFNFNQTSICPGRAICENQGQCLLDRSTCPNSTICICPDCYYGGRCQFTTNTFSLSLEAILGYQFRPYIKIVQQPNAIKVSIVLTTVTFVFGLINSILCILTFRLKTLRSVGCGLYLLTLSIVSLNSVLLYTIKFWLLLISQLLLITNRTFLVLNCISVEFLLRSLVAIADWLSACATIERVVVVIKGVNFNQAKSKHVARWMISGVVLCVLVSLVHDPIHRQLIDEEDEHRTWCIPKYSSSIRIFDSFMNIIHFFIPFLINLISPVLIIVLIARRHAITRKQHTYREHLHRQLHGQKHLIISPIITVILSFPRLIISFLYGCMKSNRNPWLYLVGYFISFIPSISMFVVFIWPSSTYKREFDAMIQRYRTKFCRRNTSFN